MSLRIIEGITSTMKSPKEGYTDDTCIITCKICAKLPVLLNPSFDILIPVTNYLRHYAIDRNNDHKTLKKIALSSTTLNLKIKELEN